VQNHYCGEFFTPRKIRIGGLGFHKNLRRKKMSDNNWVEILRGLWKEIRETGKTEKDVLISKILKTITEIFTNLEDKEEFLFLEEYIKTSKKIAQNWDFKEVDEYTLENAISFFKKTYTERFKGQRLKGGMYRVKIQEDTKFYYYLLHFFVLPQGEKHIVLIDVYSPLLLVKARSLDNDLENIFGENNLILFE
jgi:hypothetical protein